MADPAGSESARDLSGSIARVVAEVSDHVSAEDVQSDREFVADLKVDSLAMVEIVVLLEEEHGIRIADEDVRRFRRVSDLEEHLRRATA